MRRKKGNPRGDRRLRELERAAQAGGPGDLERYHAELVRRGLRHPMLTTYEQLYGALRQAWILSEPCGEVWDAEDEQDDFDDCMRAQDRLYVALSTAQAQVQRLRADPRAKRQAGLRHEPGIYVRRYLQYSDPMLSRDERQRLWTLAGAAVRWKRINAEQWRSLERAGGGGADRMRALVHKQRAGKASVQEKLELVANRIHQELLSAGHVGLSTLGRRGENDFRGGWSWSGIAGFAYWTDGTHRYWHASFYHENGDVFILFVGEGPAPVLLLPVNLILGEPGAATVEVARRAAQGIAVLATQGTWKETRRQLGLGGPHYEPGRFVYTSPRVIE